MVVAASAYAVAPARQLGVWIHAVQNKDFNFYQVWCVIAEAALGLFVRG